MLKREAELLQRLQIEVYALQQHLRRLQAAPFRHRNPYWHTVPAKRHLQLLEESARRCLECVLPFTALMAKRKLLTRKEQHAYYADYAVLFTFAQDVARHELEHLLLLRDEAASARLHRFIAHTLALCKRLQQEEDKEGF